RTSGAGSGAPDEAALKEAPAPTDRECDEANATAATAIAAAAVTRPGPMESSPLLFHAHVTPWFFSGTVRKRLPVVAKIALSTAGAATQMVGSPTPPQNPPDG